MVNFIRQNEIEELTQLLSDIGILPVNQIKKLLMRRGKSDEQIEIILNQMVKRKFGYYDDTQTFLRANKAIKPSDMDQGAYKSIWLLIDLLNNIGDYFVIHNSPKKLTFINKNVDSQKNDPFFDVFYIPFSSEKISCYQIINEKKDTSITKCFIIIDDLSQVDKITLNDRFKIINFVLIDGEGKAEYVDMK